tara:strand:- start:806 stop:1063 length:258 start_codon:yes stop_codon:yes gene_type:complete
MKNRKLRFLVSASVFMMAVAAAFAFNTPKNENAVLKTGYIFKSGACQVDGQCTDFGSAICTHNGMDVLERIGSSCVDPLSGTWQQ